MNHAKKGVLGLLCLAATLFVATGFVAHALPLGMTAAPTASDADDGPCTGTDASTQTGECDTQLDQANGPNDDSAAGDTDTGTVEA